MKIQAQYELSATQQCPFTIMDERQIQVLKFMSLNVSGNSNAQIGQTKVKIIHTHLGCILQTLKTLLPCLKLKKE